MLRRKRRGEGEVGLHGNQRLVLRLLDLGSVSQVCPNPNPVTHSLVISRSEGHGLLVSGQIYMVLSLPREGEQRTGTKTWVLPAQSGPLRSSAEILLGLFLLPSLGCLWQSSLTHSQGLRVAVARSAPRGLRDPGELERRHDSWGQGTQEVLIFQFSLKCPLSPNTTLWLKDWLRIE